MKRIPFLFFILFLIVSTQTSGQYPPFTKWYQNPLGFKPVNLHTANGIIIPAVAATAIFFYRLVSPITEINESNR